MPTSISWFSGSRSPRGKIPVVFGLAALLIAAPPSHAGIMDSIGGVFSKITDGVKGLFGGGKGKASGDNAEFEKFLTQIETSQEQLFNAQTETINYYNENAASVNLEDARSQELLNAVTDASRTNEDLYLQYLKVRAELLEQKVDVSAYEERMAAISENQKRLEDGYQNIQDFNKESGLLEPPPPKGSATYASASPGSGGAFNPDDPVVRKAIDEWLAANGLDGYGRQVGNAAGGTIRANYDADTGGRTRHRYVWEEYWQKSGNRTNQSLFAYVTGRMGGTQEPLPPVATQEPVQPATQLATKPATQPATGGGFDPTDAVVATIDDEPQCAVPPCSGHEQHAAAPSSSQDATLRGVTDELNQAVKELQDLQARQQGGTPEGKALLEKIRGLQARRNQLLAGSN